jgi:hypothetical protein
MKKGLWFYIVLAIGGGGMLWFAGCDAVAEFLGTAGVSVDEKDAGSGNKNPPGASGISGDESISAILDPFKPDIPSFYVSGGGNDADDGTSTTPFKTLAKAYAAALGDSERKRIVVLSDLSEPGLVTLSPPTVNGSEDILIEGMDRESRPKIERSTGANDSVLAITNKAQITFMNIIINGLIAPMSTDANANNRALYISGSGTKVTLENGTVITGKKMIVNGANVSHTGSGIMVRDSAVLVMNEGSAVTGCCGEVGGGITVYNGRFTMNGGEISNNTITEYGGGLYLFQATATMNGGSIRGNTAGGKGGGVYIETNSSAFTMTGGIIYGSDDIDGSMKNTAKEGVGSGAAFYKSAGTAKKQWSNGSEEVLNTTSETIDMRQ